MHCCIMTQCSIRRSLLTMMRLQANWVAHHGRGGSGHHGNGYSRQINGKYYTLYDRAMAEKDARSLRRAQETMLSSKLASLQRQLAEAQKPPPLPPEMVGKLQE